MARRYENILLKGIHIEDGRLPVVPSHVERLMKSIKEVGLLEPIIVCRRSRKSPALVLVAGRNRLEACKRLKHKTIAAIVENDESDAMDQWRELAEIDENLIRRDLSPAQRAKLIAKRKAAYEKAHPETKHGGAKGKAGGGKKKAKGPKLDSFASDTANKTGKSVTAIKRDATRAKKLGDDLDRVAGTSLDKGSELDALAAMPAEQRAPLIARAVAGEEVSARQAPMPSRPPMDNIEAAPGPRNGFADIERAWKALQASLTSATRAAREAFHAEYKEEITKLLSELA